MKYALDTEFIEDGRTIDLLSIGIVAEDGREYYAESTKVDLSRANEWVRANVVPHLHRTGCLTADPSCQVKANRDIATEIMGFCHPATYGKPQFWTYYGDYDWVAVCQLFGTMMDLPKGWPMLAYDLRQLLDFRGYPDVTQPDDMPHHALSDARWIMETVKEFERRG